MLIFFLFLLIFFIHPLEEDGDFYHHLNTGKYVLTNLQLPHQDIWTFTAQGKEWIAYAWGGGVIFYIIFQTFGLSGISLFVSLIALITLLLLFIWLKSYQLPLKVTWPSLLMVAALFSTRWPTRPEIFTYPFLISLFLVDRFKDKYPNLVLLYPLIIFLWSIIYGSSTFVGMGILILLVINQLIKDHFQVKPQHQIFYLFSLITIPLSLLNGYSYKSIFYIFLIPQVAHFQGEWLGILDILQKAPPAYLEQFWPRLLIYSFFLTVFIVSFSRKNVRKYPLLTLLSSAVILPIFAFRQVPLAAILAAPILALNIKNTVSLYHLRSHIVIAVVLLAVAVWSNPPQLSAAENQTYLAVKQFLTDHNLLGKTYTDQNLGSYLSFHLYPQILVSNDTRDDLFLGTDYLKDLHSPFKDLVYILSKYKAEVAIVNIEEESTKAKSLLNHPHWSVVYSVNQYLILVPKKSTP